MDTKQQNELFKALGSIQSTQDSILKEISNLKTDMTESIKAVSERIDKTELLVKEGNARLEKKQDAYQEKNDVRVKEVETKVNNLRIKIAGYGGGAGLLVLMIAEAIKMQTGGN